MNIHLLSVYLDGVLSLSMMHRNGIEVFSLRHHAHCVLIAAQVAWKWQRGLIQRYFMGVRLPVCCSSSQHSTHKAINALSMNMTIDHECASARLAMGIALRSTFFDPVPAKVCSSGAHFTSTSKKIGDSFKSDRVLVNGAKFVLWQCLH
ncbi:hypothetical protein POF45_04255 [Pseudomonas sp. 681]|uniref:Uncharacterized protein n=1 Tax=Pseudomonas fungipugnans TaxID=3024217 RepID=A0ABT6QID3_9PSED|nr:hypothetical protein [Pseudomonas sp. 681]MDI2590647.1 hypothetical protein [Pseudomonas sp. 681]